MAILTEKGIDCMDTLQGGAYYARRGSDSGVSRLDGTQLMRSFEENLRVRRFWTPRGTLVD